jgi:hypothetical protein
MTTQELRELDAWIAEHVMGWKKVGLLADFTKGTFICNTSADCLAEDWKKDGRTATWKPTTDSAAAMEVLKMCAEKCCVKMRHQDLGLWCVWQHQFTGEMEGALDNPEGNATTLELAICLFAKKLFGKDKE